MTSLNAIAWKILSPERIKMVPEERELFFTEFLYSRDIEEVLQHFNKDEINKNKDLFAIMLIYIQNQDFERFDAEMQCAIKETLCKLNKFKFVENTYVHKTFKIVVSNIFLRDLNSGETDFFNEFLSAFAENSYLNVILAYFTKKCIECIEDREMQTGVCEKIFEMRDELDIVNNAKLSKNFINVCVFLMIHKSDKVKYYVSNCLDNIQLFHFPLFIKKFIIYIRDEGDELRKQCGQLLAKVKNNILPGLPFQLYDAVDELINEIPGDLLNSNDVFEFFMIVSDFSISIFTQFPTQNNELPLKACQWIAYFIKNFYKKPSKDVRRVVEETRKNILVNYPPPVGNPCFKQYDGVYSKHRAQLLYVCYERDTVSHLLDVIRGSRGNKERVLEACWAVTDIFIQFYDKMSGEKKLILPIITEIMKYQSQYSGDKRLTCSIIYLLSSVINIQETSKREDVIRKQITPVFCKMLLTFLDSQYIEERLIAIECMTTYENRTEEKFVKELVLFVPKVITHIDPEVSIGFYSSVAKFINNLEEESRKQPLITQLLDGPLKRWDPLWGEMFGLGSVSGLQMAVVIIRTFNSVYSEIGDNEIIRNFFNDLTDRIDIIIESFSPSESKELTKLKMSIIKYYTNFFINYSKVPGVRFCSQTLFFNLINAQEKLDMDFPVFDLIDFIIRMNIIKEEALIQQAIVHCQDLGHVAVSDSVSMYIAKSKNEEFREYYMKKMKDIIATDKERAVLMLKSAISLSTHERSVKYLSCIAFIVLDKDNNYSITARNNAVELLFKILRKAEVEDLEEMALIAYETLAKHLITFYQTFIIKLYESAQANDKEKSSFMEIVGFFQFTEYWFRPEEDVDAAFAESEECEEEEASDKGVFEINEEEEEEEEDGEYIPQEIV